MPRTAQNGSHHSFGRPSLRSMARTTQNESHQLVGDEGYSLSPSSFLTSDSKQPCNAAHGQHDCGSIHKSSRGDKVPILDGGGLGSPQLGSEEQHNAISFSHKWQSERHSRQTQQKGQAMSTEWSIHPSVIEAIKLTWGTPSIDLFATAENFKFPVYVSPCPGSRAWAVDALSLNWDGMFAYAFLPFPLIPKVLQKIQTTQCRVILVAPLWPSRSWFSLLTSLLYDFPRKVPAKVDLLRQHRSTIFCKTYSQRIFTSGRY